MSKKENKAIEWLKYLQETREEQIRQQAWVGTNTFDAIYAILNLIEKQQQEIEKLKNTETYKIAIIDKDKYVSKDKIREKINKLKNNDIEYSEHIAMLEELLEGDNHEN